MDEIDIFQAEQRIYDEAAAYAGADEKYKKLTKEYGRLLKQLRRSTKIADRTTSDLNESNVDLTDKIHYDVMTGIYNRRFLEENLVRLIRSVSRHGGELSILMIDVDCFKKYNDTYGHSEGDKCLKAVAAILTESLSRADDFAARYGGEEFVVALPNTGRKGAGVVADKILENIRAKNMPHEKNEAAACVTVSIGITTARAAHQQSGADYIKRADEALYISKQSGRNGYTYLSF